MFHINILDHLKGLLPVYHIHILGHLKGLLPVYHINILGHLKNLLPLYHINILSHGYSTRNVSGFVDAVEYPITSHYSDVIMSVMVSHITGVIIFAQPFAQQIKENIKAPRHPLWGKPPMTSGSPHKGPVIGEMFQFDDVIMWYVDLKYIDWNIFAINISSKIIALSRITFMCKNIV